MTNNSEHRIEEMPLQDNTLAGFCNVQNKDELLAYLNKAQVIVYGDKARAITKRSFNYYAYSSNAKHRYISFQIPKKDGSSRTIDAPCESLKIMQKALSILLESVYVPNQSAMGFVNGRSIVDNAKVHLGKSFVYNIDLKNFFPSITAGRICARLQAKPYIFDKNIASLIADICCHKNADGISVLPQGAPTSPIVTNIVCEKLDYKLQNLAKAFHLTYSRYADDITFSGNRNMFNEEGKFCKKLRQIVEEQEHFKINENKTRLCQRGGRKEVTGLTVNDRLNTSRKYMRQIRTMIHNWENLGYEKAQEIFLGVYNKTNTKNHNAKGVHHLENVLAGKLMFMAMVKGKDDQTYKNLNSRFEKLYEDHFGWGTFGEKSISDILDVWENEGIDAALALYESQSNKKDVEKNGKADSTEKSNRQSKKSSSDQLDGGPVNLHDFFKDEELDSAYKRNVKYKGKTYVCPEIVTKSGKRVILSARLVSEGFTVEDWGKEIEKNTHEDIGVIRFQDSPQNTYYVSHIKGIHQGTGDSVELKSRFDEENALDCAFINQGTGDSVELKFD